MATEGQPGGAPKRQQAQAVEEAASGLEAAFSPDIQRRLILAARYLPFTTSFCRLLPAKLNGNQYRPPDVSKLSFCHSLPGHQPLTRMMLLSVPFPPLPSPSLPFPPLLIPPLPSLPSPSLPFPPLPSSDPGAAGHHQKDGWEDRVDGGQ